MLDPYHLQSCERILVCAAWAADGDSDWSHQVVSLPSLAWSCPHARAGMEAIRKLLRDGKEVNQLSVAGALAAAGNQQAFEPLMTAETAAGGFVDRGAFETALATVKEHSERRRLERVARQMLAWVHDAERPVKETFDHSLAALAEWNSSDSRTGGWERDILKQEAELIREGRQQEGYLDTGLDQVDYTTGGFGPRQLIVIVAWPKTGKTAFLLQLARKFSREVGPCLFWEGEMDVREMAQRSAAQAAQVPVRKLEASHYDQAAAAAGELYIETARGDLDAFRARVHRWMAQFPNTAALFVDYVGLLQDHSTKTNAVQAAAEVSATLEGLAHRYELPVIVAQQMNRNILGRSDKTPILSDLRDGQKLAQDAHKVIFLHKPSHWKEGVDPSLVELHVVANRNGETGVVQLRLSGPTLTFHPYHRKPSEQPADEQLEFDDRFGGDFDEVDIAELCEGIL